MGSQNKVTNYSDLIHYFELKKSAVGSHVDMRSISYVVQPKCDGISVEIEYKNGVLVDAITRGDGQIGDVITQNVVKMRGLVLSLPKDLSCSIRCEIMVTKKDFEELNKIIKKDALPSLSKGGLRRTSEGEIENEGFYSNPRNAASGISQRLDSKFSEYCSLYAVDISVSLNESDKINLLKKFGFTTVETVVCQDFDDIEKIYQEFFTTKRNTYPFEIDGLVVKINDLNIVESLDVKNNRPQFQVAYKFPASTNTTVIKSITWQIGPLGSITPVAEVEPIELSGAIITFASLANYDLVKKMDLNIGDIIKISRRGDVIPHVEEVITKIKPGHIDIPSHCPSCNTLLTVEDKLLRCRNINCLPQIIGCLNLFCQTLEILGISEKTITKLYDSGKIRLPGDFYRLTIDDIKDLDNLGEKSAKNILHQIDKKRELSLVEVFDAAIIPNFSRKRIQQLIDFGFNTPQKLLNITVGDIEPLFGFQITLAKKIIDGINLRRSWIESILSQVNLSPLAHQRSSALSGLSFCITGDLSIPRKQLEQTITDNGGKVTSTVSKNTSYLITNETDSNSSKFTTAKKLNIKIISEEEFHSLVA
jgi:DNA ligase (NAD+)